jgi:monofunctional biosynthetic peptidoglycan transglycosylase
MFESAPAKSQLDPGSSLGPQGFIRKYKEQPARILRWGAFVVAFLLLAPYAVTPLYLIVNPPFSFHMARQALAGHGIERDWRSLDNISPNLVTQVIVSEDARFCQHWGVDWSALGEAVEALEDGGKGGGASTISMQVVKNLYLWNGRSYVRKAFELPLALYADLLWSKRRMLEIYLNIAEWAPGVFGAEAAARHHFGKPASNLSRQEAAQLAAALPNPIRRSAGRPGRGTFALANRLRARAAGERAAAACVFR